MGGVVKSGPFPTKENETNVVLISLFYILLIWGCVRTQRTPLPTGVIYRTDRDGAEVDCGEVVQAAPVVVVWVVPVVVWTVVRLSKLLQ